MTATAAVAAARRKVLPIPGVLTVAVIISPSPWYTAGHTDNSMMTVGPLSPPGMTTVGTYWVEQNRYRL